MSTRSPWAQTADKRTWCASTGTIAMFVTRVSTGLWRAAVGDVRSTELPTRLAAQRWAESRTGGAE